VSKDALELGRHWQAFCEARGIGVMAHDKDEKIGQAYIAGYFAGIGSMNGKNIEQPKDMGKHECRVQERK
jgi:hypothetical protein